MRRSRVTEGGSARPPAFFCARSFATFASPLPSGSPDRRTYSSIARIAPSRSPRCWRIGARPWCATAIVASSLIDARKCSSARRASPRASSTRPRQQRACAWFGSSSTQRFSGAYAASHGWRALPNCAKPIPNHPSTSSGSCSAARLYAAIALSQSCSFMNPSAAAMQVRRRESASAAMPEIVDVTIASRGRRGLAQLLRQGRDQPWSGAARPGGLRGAGCPPCRDM